ncbi:FHA domain-containing protein [Pseudomaricurvus alkylphenolicus]|uniref:FHA domain-containing protein n=1 Tax=Pseudomaricurvus alkylphenolicus TaxID=1306991 RepID=UPI001420AA63|nr:FHA domain-containing protein [Pseudomaricurvus alkylphenolicus]NIB44553.1 FHA domain-containing protein [Pseudomaricurvus alkylphenolicus]
MLKLRFSNNKHNEVWLVEPKVVLGSSQECDVVLKGEAVHPRHIEIKVEHEVLTLSLLKESNQTRVNNKPVKPGQPISLNPADTLSIAGNEIVVVDPKQEARPAPKAAPVAAAAAPAAPKPQKAENTGWSLKANHAALANKVFNLGTDTTVGRSNDCDITLAAAHLSRRHAQLTVKDGVLYVKDLGSANGTYVNGNKITESRVKRGDDLRFDTLSFGVMGPADDLDKTTVRGASLDATAVRPAAAISSATGVRASVKAPQAATQAKAAKPVETVEPTKSGNSKGLWIGLVLVAIIGAGVFAAIQGGWL